MSQNDPGYVTEQKSGGGSHVVLIVLAVVVAAVVIFTGGFLIGNSGDTSETPENATVPTPTVTLGGGTGENPDDGDTGGGSGETPSDGGSNGDSGGGAAG
jgi:hypothetical protein